MLVEVPRAPPFVHDAPTFVGRRLRIGRDLPSARRLAVIFVAVSHRGEPRSNCSTILASGSGGNGVTAQNDRSPGKDGAAAGAGGGGGGSLGPKPKGSYASSPDVGSSGCASPGDPTVRKTVAGELFAHIDIIGLFVLVLGRLFVDHVFYEQLWNFWAH